MIGLAIGLVHVLCLADTILIAKVGYFGL